MSGRREGDLIVGLDVGTSKVLAVVAEILADDQIEIIASDIIHLADLERVWLRTSNRLSSPFSGQLKKQN